MRVGFTLQPNVGDLDRLATLIDDDVDYYEVAPETLWLGDADDRFLPNGFHDRFLELKCTTQRPFVAHGVGLSLGSVSPDDAPRRARWHERIARDHEAFEFQWYTDHLGVSVLAGEYAMLPLPVPMTDVMADVIHDNLRALQAIVPDVGVENSVIYHQLGAMTDEPEFLRRILRSPGMHMVLDLHNVFTMAQNVRFDAWAYIDALDLERVIEIHLSGGADSNPAWLESASTLRLDSHCSAVPDDVWALFEYAWPRCPNLRGVTLERLEGTIETQDVEPLRAELRRIRSVLGATA